MKNSLNRILCFSLLTLMLSTGFVRAEDAQQSPMPQMAAQPKPEENVSLPPEDEEITILKDEYAGILTILFTLENLAEIILAAWCFRL